MSVEINIVHIPSFFNVLLGMIFCMITTYDDIGGGVWMNNVVLKEYFLKHTISKKLQLLQTIVHTISSIEYNILRINELSHYIMIKLILLFKVQCKFKSKSKIGDLKDIPTRNWTVKNCHFGNFDACKDISSALFSSRMVTHCEWTKMFHIFT